MLPSLKIKVNNSELKAFGLLCRQIILENRTRNDAIIKMAVFDVVSTLMVKCAKKLYSQRKTYNISLQTYEVMIFEITLPEIDHYFSGHSFEGNLIRKLYGEINRYETGAAHFQLT